MSNSAAAQQGSPAPNVLFIAIDDLAATLGVYGDPVAKSPNIDRFAGEGLVFDRAYCAVAICHPSRAAILTGRRPTTSGIYNFQPAIRQAMPDVVTLPQHFKANGYHAVGLGKIFHGPQSSDPVSWSVPPFWASEPAYHTPEGVRIAEHIARERPMATLHDPASGTTLTRAMAGLPWEAPDVADSALNDGVITERALEVLREPRDEPFFLAVGYMKPHLPFVAPKKYWDLYDREEFALPQRDRPPEDAPHYTMYGWQDTRRYWGMPWEGNLTAEQTRDMLHGYYACVSFIDAQVGRLLEEVDRLGLRDNTIVVIWSDHGYNLGFYGEWDKRNNYEISTLSPLMVRIPGHRPAGARTQALVEFVDIYPSLCDLAGLRSPEGLEGLSFKALIEDPARPWKSAAFSYIDRVVEGAGPTVGTAMRTDRYRFVEWVNESGTFRGYELYDHERDPGETVNLAGRPEHAATVDKLRSQLHAGWRGALPPER